MYVEYVPKSNAPKPINWIAVRAEYEAGGITLQQLADKLGVSLRTVLRRSKKELWAKGVTQVSQEVSQKVSQKVREQVVAQRVQNALDDLGIINSVINSCFDAIQERPDNFKTSGEAIAALDKMLKIKLEYSDEHVQKWLLSKGYVAVPIAEFAPSIEDSDKQPESSFSDILGEAKDISASTTAAD